MENTPSPTPTPTPASNVPNAPAVDALQTGRLYSGKAPVELKIVAGLMFLGGIILILAGLPLLLFFGLGILFIVLGCFEIKYAMAIFRLQKKGYVGGLVILWLSIVVSIATDALPVMVRGLTALDFTAADGIGLVMQFLYIAIVYKHRDKFVN